MKKYWKNVREIFIWKYFILIIFAFYIDQWFPTFFVWRAIYFLWKALRATRLIFYIPLPLLPPFDPLLIPARQTARGFGGALLAPQRGLGRSPSRQRILEHYRAKVIVSDMFREILQRSKQLEIFRFRPRISYFHHNGIAAHTPLAYTVKMGMLQLLHIYF